MRVVLFLAVLGVITGGAKIDEGNPTASAFDAALGETGKIVFGVVIWSAAITSVIGASYTSTSFLKVFGRWVTHWERWVVVAFIVVSTGLFLLLGAEPVKLLIFAGAFNGLILPVGLGLLLWIAFRRTPRPDVRLRLPTVAAGRRGGRLAAHDLPRLGVDHRAQGPLRMTIDLNSDLGEGFGIWPLGDDEAMVGVWSPAPTSPAASMPATLAPCCRPADGPWSSGVAIGAQVAYRDLAGFGRGSSTSTRRTSRPT